MKTLNDGTDKFSLHMKKDCSDEDAQDDWAFSSLNVGKLTLHLILFFFKIFQSQSTLWGWSLLCHFISKKYQTHNLDYKCPNMAAKHGNMAVSEQCNILNRIVHYKARLD